MNTIVDATELYDLFGENLFCSICQENVNEGERVRTIRDCQHGFHVSCVDKWLNKEGICPLCRRTVYDTPSLRYFLHNYPGFVLENILTQVEGTISGYENVLERYILGYCLAYGILRKFKSAEPYREHSASIRSTLADFHLDTMRPFPLDSSTRNSLIRSRDALRNEVIRRIGWEGNRRDFNKIDVVRNVFEKISLLEEENIRSVWLH